MGKRRSNIYSTHILSCFTYVTLFAFHNHHEESIIIFQFPDLKRMMQTICSRQQSKQVVKLKLEFRFEWLANAITTSVQVIHFTQYLFTKYPLSSMLCGGIIGIISVLREFKNTTKDIRP